MSIHVTVSGNPVNIRRGRMVLSDLDQIKKNERDRRRRLRLEQVRQQSKEISNRLLERAKKIAREELNKLEKDENSELRQMHNRKIMEIQQKYQEDLEDIGQAHTSAALQPDVNAIIEEEEKKDRAMALKRGKEAAQRMKEAQKEDSEESHQKRLHKVREEENIRAAIVAKLPKPTTIEENKTKTISSQDNASKDTFHETLTTRKKIKKILSKKSLGKAKKSNLKEYQKILSPKPGTSGLQKHKISPQKKTDETNHIPYIDNTSDDQLPRRTVPIRSITSTKADKIARYNPEDYMQDTSDTSSISSSSSSSISDDSSYFSDSVEQITCNKTSRTTSLTDSKVRLYDHSTRQRNIYNKPFGIVERIIDIGNEPNAIEAAQALKDAENIKACTMKTCKLNAQRRGENAILREKVRRDYQVLLQNLDHLAQEERKLKASQIQSNAEENIHMRLYQRNKCQDEHRKKLDRAAKSVLSTDVPTQYTHLTERVITLPSQNKSDMHKDVPHSTWQESHLVEERTTVCDTQQDEDSEISREEQILDMLKKVERQKRLLLQEFGANLPDNIFNASIRTLFENRTPAEAPPQVANNVTPLSPEIKVIDMSSCNKCVKKDRTGKKSVKTSLKKIEIAVQAALDKTVPAEDKSVQVELPQEKVDMTHSNEDRITQIPHPIEPQVTIITPETGDSSNSSNDSTSSEITGMIIEIDKKEITVTPKRRKGSSIKVSKRSSPRIYQKICSTSVSSKATSPMKRFSRSQSSSRLISPQKKTKCLDTPDTINRRVDIRMKSAFNDETEPSQETRMSVDASAESSQTISGMNGQDRCLGKPYQIRTQMKRWIRIKDTSDTSTSFASPPPVKPKSMIDALTSVTPILEMLDTSRHEELQRLRQDISPVSTPETPSPRTMRMPSNIPHRDKISRVLRYNSIDSQTNGSTILSSTQNDQSTLTDPSDAHLQDSTPSGCQSTPLQQLPISSKVCICKNPKCKLLHMKLDDIHDYALKNCPEILQKYEDLQNLCTQRIASLTDLIERVRNEQKGMDLSLISPSDETSLMQLPTSKSMRSTTARTNIQAVRNLIESIEVVHAELAKTLLVESQKVMGNEAISEEPSQDAGVQATTSTPRSKLIDTITVPIQKSEVIEGKVKPKIISDEKVNIQFNRFKTQQKPQAISGIKTLERNSWPLCTSLQEEEIIETLSREILEQSKSLDKASNALIILKENGEISLQHKKRLLPSKDVSLKNNSLLKQENNNNVTEENSPITEAIRESDFIPILTGIPKVSRNHGTVTSISARTKPPVTLLNAPYWQELESSGHELSTIVEFDTTDTINKSIKSQTKSKSINADVMDDSQKILLKRIVDVEPSKSVTVKPSVHVAPLPVQQNPSSSEKTIDSTTNVKHSVEKLISTQRSQETTNVCNSPEKLKNVSGTTTTKVEAERESVDYALEKCNKQLQCNTTEEPALHTKDGLGSSISTDFNNQQKNSQYKTTSTSLNSFSGLSGISEIASSPSSDFLKDASSPEEMEAALKKLGLDWAVTTLKKTREASALSSSSNSDVTPMNTARRISPPKKHFEPNSLPDISDVSSISIKEASKSTEQVVLLKGRTSTPKFHNSNTNSERSGTTNTSESLQEPSDSLTIPNVSLTKTKSDNNQLQSP